MLRVGVTGGREFDDQQFVYDVLDQIHDHCEITVLIHGAARGLDTFAGDWAKSRGVEVKEFPAEWDKHGPKRAGFIRNRDMIVKGLPDVVLVFEGGNGTADMRRQCDEHDVPIELIRPDHFKSRTTDE